MIKSTSGMAKRFCLNILMCFAVFDWALHLFWGHTVSPCIRWGEDNRWASCT